VVLLGGALWGVAGMFLSIPFVAILKIIFDRLPEMKPWANYWEMWYQPVIRRDMDEKNSKAGRTGGEES
jgi:predicted PurR-regulated permease PerM